MAYRSPAASGYLSGRRFAYQEDISLVQDVDLIADEVTELLTRLQTRGLLETERP